MRSTLASELAACEGFLEKQGADMIGNWKKRWFVLRGAKLLYYERKDKYASLGQPKGFILIDGTTDVRAVPDLRRGKKYAGLGLVLSSDQGGKARTYNLVAPNLEAVHRWVDAIKEERSKHDRSGGDNGGRKGSVSMRRDSPSAMASPTSDTERLRANSKFGVTTAEPRTPSRSAPDEAEYPFGTPPKSGGLAAPPPTLRGRSFEDVGSAATAPPSKKENKKAKRLREEIGKADVKLRNLEQELSRKDAELEEIQQKYFVSLCLFVKMNLVARGAYSNRDTYDLYDQAVFEHIPSERWSAWIREKLESDARMEGERQPTIRDYSKFDLSGKTYRGGR